MSNRKMVVSDHLDADLTEVADAIRSKTGGIEDLDFPGGFVSAVESIGGGTDYIAQFLSGTEFDYVSDEVTKIADDNQLYKLTKIKSIDLPNWTSGGTYAFQNCYGLTSAKCPSLQIVPGACFFNCTALERIELGENLTHISWSAFKNCSALTAIIIRKNGKANLDSTTGTSGTFYGAAIASGTGYIYVPRSQVATYKADSAWSTYANQIRAIEDYPEITG